MLFVEARTCAPFGSHFCPPFHPHVLSCGVAWLTWCVLPYGHGTLLRTCAAFILQHGGIPLHTVFYFLGWIRFIGVFGIQTPWSIENSVHADEVVRNHVFAGTRGLLTFRATASGKPATNTANFPPTFLPTPTSRTNIAGMSDLAL